MSERRTKRSATDESEMDEDLSAGAESVVEEEAAAADVAEEVEDLGEPAPYEPLVIDPPDESTTTVEPDRPEPLPEGSVTLAYRGPADVLTHGEFRFRVGQPVIVPSAVAEELLTTPFEEFELV